MVGRHYPLPGATKAGGTYLPGMLFCFLFIWCQCNFWCPPLLFVCPQLTSQKYYTTSINHLVYGYTFFNYNTSSVVLFWKRTRSEMIVMKRQKIISHHRQANQSKLWHTQKLYFRISNELMLSVCMFNTNLRDTGTHCTSLFTRKQLILMQHCIQLHFTFFW